MGAVLLWSWEASNHVYAVSAHPTTFYIHQEAVKWTCLLILGQVLGIVVRIFSVNMVKLVLASKSENVPFDIRAV